MANRDHRRCRDARAWYMLGISTNHSCQYANVLYASCTVTAEPVFQLTTKCDAAIRV